MSHIDSAFQVICLNFPIGQLSGEADQSALIKNPRQALCTVLLWRSIHIVSNTKAKIFYHPQRNVFTPVCHSVHGGCVCPSACWQTPPPPGSRHLPQQTATATGMHSLNIYFEQESITVRCETPARPLYVLQKPTNVITRKGGIKWTSLNRSPVLATRYHWQGKAGFLYSGHRGGRGVRIRWCPMHHNIHFWPPAVNRHAHMTENITFSQLCWRAGIKYETFPRWQVGFFTNRQNWQ